MLLTVVNPGPDLQPVATGEARQGLAGVHSKAIDDMPRPVLAAFQKHTRLGQSRAGASGVTIRMCLVFANAFTKKQCRRRNSRCSAASKRDMRKVEESKGNAPLTAPRSPPRKLPVRSKLWGTAAGIKSKLAAPKMGRSPPSDKG